MTTLLLWTRIRHRQPPLLFVPTAPALVSRPTLEADLRSFFHFYLLMVEVIIIERVSFLLVRLLTTLNTNLVSEHCIILSINPGHSFSMICYVSFGMYSFVDVHHPFCIIQSGTNYYSYYMLRIC